MKPETAEFWAGCLNTLFEKDKPYIIAEKYEDHCRGGVIVSVNKFNRARFYVYEFDGKLGAFNWSDSYGIYSPLQDQVVEISYTNQCIQIEGLTGAGERCWRTLRRLDNNHYREFVQWDERSWGRV